MRYFTDGLWGLGKLDRRRDWDAPLMLTLLVWLCTLPLVGLFVLPIFGIGVAAAVAAGWLMLVLLICWALCWTADDGRWTMGGGV
jgi:ABC-type proline/glycine betaine transport system permease subunit